MSGGVVQERYQGTPQGRLLSPLLADVLLEGWIRNWSGVSVGAAIMAAPYADFICPYTNVIKFSANAVLIMNPPFKQLR